jgi:hypothetical protein
MMAHEFEVMKTRGMHRGSASYATAAQVAPNNFMYNNLGNATLANFTNRYAGMMYAWVPSFTTRFKPHVASESIMMTGTNRFVGVEIEANNATTFHFNFVDGNSIAGGGTDRRFSDGSVWGMSAWYKFGWFIDSNANTDSFWINNVAHPINGIPNKSLTLLLNSNLIFGRDTPIGFKIGMMFVSYDPTITYQEFVDLYSSYQNKSPIYLSPGWVSQTNGKYRQVYIENGTPTIMNHATGQPFLSYNTGSPVLYNHILDRVVIP